MKKFRKCSERQPRKCFYFEKFNRCKFGDFCLYSHLEDIGKAYQEYELQNVKERVSLLEKLVKEKEVKVTDLENKIYDIEKENADIRSELLKANDRVKQVVELTVNQTTDAVIKQLTSLQSQKEKETTLKLNSLSEHVCLIANLIKTQTSSSPTKYNPESHQEISFTRNLQNLPKP